MVRHLWAFGFATLVGCNSLTGANDLEEVPDFDSGVAIDAEEDSQEIDSAHDDTAEETNDSASDAADVADTNPCSNGKLDVGETDVDCGGTCPDKCADEKTCADSKDCASGHCIDSKCAACPTKMTAVTSGTTKFCIDTLEVTNADYKAFLAASPTTTGQPSYCSWNTSFIPGNGSLTAWPLATKYDPHPVRVVDWCDAYAYCRHAGKRLCGKIGGGTVGYASDYANAGLSEWMNACTSGGANTYTYSGSFVASKCNDKGSLVGTTVATGSLTLCKNAADDFDMNGNVSEWEDDCQASSGATDLCRVRGGSYNTLDPRCSVNESQARNSQTVYTGFRCCSD